MMNDFVPSDPNFWGFLTLVWKDHPFIFVLLVILIWGGVGAIRNKTSFLEYWINGYTPHFLRRRKKGSKTSDIVKEGE